MLKSYIKIGLRNLLKYKTNTAIHVFGLAIGLAAFLLINQYVSFEKSYDRFHKNADRLYRVTTDIASNGQVHTRDAMTYAPTGKALEEALPEVIGSTTTLLMEAMTFLQKEKPIQEDLLAVDENFLKLFDYPILVGNPTDLLKEPHTLVLTESHAKKYFGNENPVGKTINYVNYGGTNSTFKVTGLIADPPENNHYPFKMLVSISTVKKRMDSDAWNGNNYYGYILLDEQADIAAVRKKLPALSKQLISDDGEDLFNLQAITDIHLHSDMAFEPTVHGSSRAVKFLRIISLFILFIAWINYVNLSTARAVERAKEVGMRKVVGARKSQLIGQFFTESVLVNFFGMLVALLFAYLALPFFNQLIGKSVLTSIWTSPEFMKNLLIFFALGTLITGIYPAMVLSSFRPIGVLKGSFSRSKQGVFLRKNLVIFQFAASFALIAGTIVVHQQLRYMTNQELGMNTDQVLTFYNPEYNGENMQQFRSKFKTFKNTLRQKSNIEHVGVMACLPGGKNSDINSTDGSFNVPGVSTPVKATVYLNFINDEAIDVLDLKILAGRAFNRQLASDSNAIMVNHSLLKLMNIPNPESVLGKEFKKDNNFQFTIVGVLDDFNRSTLKHQIEPTFFLPGRVTGNSIVKLNTKDITGAISMIESTYNEFFPGAAFEATFLDDKFEKLYKEDQKFGDVFSIFSLLTIFVAIMGLFGLASFLSLKRTKEIGIRKVLGASIPEIILMFFKDFVILVIIGLVIGIPLIYLGMTEWLNGYAFRIEFPWWAMLVATAILILISFLTVSMHSYKVARMNPVESIKTE